MRQTTEIFVKGSSQGLASETLGAGGCYLACMESYLLSLHYFLIFSLPNLKTLSLAQTAYYRVIRTLERMSSYGFGRVQ